MPPAEPRVNAAKPTIQRLSPIEAEEWAFHDNYFGGEPYGGRSVAFHQGKPVWIAVYYGWVEGPLAERSG